MFVKGKSVNKEVSMRREKKNKISVGKIIFSSFKKKIIQTRELRIIKIIDFAHSKFQATSKK